MINLRRDNIFKIITTIIIPIVLLIILAFINLEPVYKAIIYILIYLLIGGDIVIEAYRNIRKSQFNNEKVLVVFATILAFCFGRFAEAVVVMLIFQIGDFFQDRFIKGVKARVVKPYNTHSKTVTVKEDGIVNQIDADYVKNGDIVIVNPGEVIQFDGRVVLGSSYVNSRLISGEDDTKEVGLGDRVLAGYINNSSVIEIKVLKESNESTIDNIYKELQKAGERKSEIERKVTKYASRVSMFVMLAAVLIAVLFSLFTGDIEKWVYTGLTILLIASPSIVILSIPITYFAGLGAAARNGAIVKGGDYLEKLNYVDSVTFTKTGTLTKGEYVVSKVIPEPGVDADLLLEVAAFAESVSDHPIATTIKRYFGKRLDDSSISAYRERPGEGVIVVFQGREVAVGNEKLMIREKIEYTAQNTIGTVIYVAMDGKCLGSILLTDNVKDESNIAVKELKSQGVKKVSIIAGDNDNSTRKISQDIYADEYSAELTPEQKALKIEEKVSLKRNQKSNVMFVGNGINDADAIKRADIGVAMGTIGNDYANQVADVIMLTDNPRKLTTLLKIAKGTKLSVIQNLAATIGIKLLIVILSMLFAFPMWIAMILDLLASMFAILNGLRLLNIK